MAAIESKKVILKNGLEVCLRTPVLDDVEKLLVYRKAFFADDRFLLITAEEAQERQTPEKQQERIEESCRDDNRLAVVTIADGAIVSLAHIRCGLQTRVQHVGHVGIGILPDYRGIGLGTAVMQVMIGWTQGNPAIEKLSLSVWDFNERAIGLYQKLGFIEEGRRIREIKFGSDDYADEILMYKDVQTGANNGNN